MDPLSHGIIGLSTFALSMTPSLQDPACLGAVLGAMAPDIDIVTKLKGDYVYLRHHRVETHSVPGIIILSILITLGLFIFFPTFTFKKVFVWTLLGSLSHLLFDLLNSYGVAILYPFTRKKYSMSLLMIYDPMILFLTGYIIFFSKGVLIESYIMIATFIAYLLIRVFNRERLKRKLKNCYGKDYRIHRVNLMPSTYHPFEWDFVISSNDYYIIGFINTFTGRNHTFKKLRKVESPIIQKTLKDRLGIFFKNFTPIFHVDITREKEKVVVRMTDLRYRFRNEFMHHASFYYNDEEDLICSIFHPFSIKNGIEVHSLKSVDSH